LDAYLLVGQAAVMTITTDRRVCDLVDAIRSGLQDGGAAATVAALTGRPPVLPPGGLPGDPAKVAGPLLHAEAELSLIALVWLPGQVTRIHDHLCWCVVHVLQGSVLETRYHAQDDVVTATSARHRPVGSTSVLRPPNDIHRLANVAADTAITLHVYGMDLRTGSSTRRRYADPRNAS
jgi:predicted metal-dependent enzyme (double-stranded beta helix superfamily)